jgi:hypothetical protein
VRGGFAKCHSWLQLFERDYAPRTSLVSLKFHRPIRNREAVAPSEWFNQPHKQHAPDSNQRRQCHSLACALRPCQGRFFHKKTLLRIPARNFYLITSAFACSACRCHLNLCHSKSSGRAKTTREVLLKHRDLPAANQKLGNQECAIGEVCAELKQRPSDSAFHLRYGRKNESRTPKTRPGAASLGSSERREVFVEALASRVEMVCMVGQRRNIFRSAFQSLLQGSLRGARLQPCCESRKSVGLEPRRAKMRLTSQPCHPQCEPG